MGQLRSQWDAVIIGGGLAGLTTAIYLSRAGLSVLLAEKADRLGGRAMSVKKRGAVLNLGVHAFYQGGEGEEVLRELGVKLKGANPPPRIAGVWNNKAYEIPTGPVKLITSGLFSLSGKAELVLFMMKLGKIRAESLEGLTLREWAEREIRDPMIRHVVYSVCRANSFMPDPDLHGAREAVRQLQRSFAGKAFYLDGGWSALISDLANVAEQSGAAIATGLQVAEAAAEDEQWALRLADGRMIRAASIVMTGSPDQAMKLVKDSEKTSLARWKAQARPMRAACLDLVLRKLPNAAQSCIAGFWLDAPLFYNSPSSVAKLNEDGTVTIHLVKQLGDRPRSDARDDELQLEAAMDLMQPGWRKEELARQFLPNITVVYDFPTADKERFAPPGPHVPETIGLYVAGDWVSHGEVLADAALASARRAANAIIKRHMSIERRMGG